MSFVIAEWNLEAPADLAWLRPEPGAESSAQPAAKAELMRGFVSRDSKHGVGLYRASAAQDVLATLSAAPAPAHVYPVHSVAHSEPEPPPGYSTVVAQRDLTQMAGLSLEAVEYLASDPHGCGKRLRLHHFGGYLAHDLTRMVCVYYCPDAESVRKANRENGTPWEHLWRGEYLRR